jgi:hypothetical protein
MLCECCLGITPDTSLFWYYYTRPGTAKLFTLGSGYLYAETVGMSKLMLSSRAAGKGHNSGGSWWKCMNQCLR